MVDLFGNNNKPQPAKIRRVRASKGFMGAGNMAEWYKFRKILYLDIRIFRGRDQIKRIVIEDNGEEDISLSGIGILRIPREIAMREGYAGLLFYQVGNPEPLEFNAEREYVALQPTMKYIPAKALQKMLETQTVADILAEEEKDTGWLMYVVMAVVAIGILFFIMG